MFCLTSYRLFSLNICSSAINFRDTASMPDSLTVKQASSGLIGKSGFGAIHTPLIGKMSATAEELKSRPTKPINRAPSANRLWIPTLEVLMSNLVNSQEGQYQIKVF